LVARIADALGDRAARLEHVGSTSVPGLAAKDVIDLQVGVTSLADADEAAFVADLTQRGFLRVPEFWHDNPHPRDGDVRRWAKRFHASMDPGRAANVHIREIGSPGWVFALQFRDWLRAEPEELERYASLKRALAAAAPSTDAYAEAKEPWFADAYTRVLDWARNTGWTDDSGRKRTHTDG
jgi:dephospho-CoA kinase